ncbi:MAG: response regulator [Desulfobulbaceae bacterium]|nr:MAG: response regulator [Desulfobulbaceae bacterium]
MTQQTHILLVEDDRRLIQLIRDYLEKQDFQVTTAERGDIAVTLITQTQPDLVILDLMLPGKDGLSVCREVRHRYPGPILILTAREEDSDQVAGLELGADDYVKKPVEPRVLLARIRALLRRLSQPHPEAQKEATLVFDKLVICPESRKVTFEDQEVDLTSSEFDLIHLLAEAAGTIVDRDSLFRSLRGIEYDGLDRSVDVSISRLRKKLGDSSTKPFKIKTVWGQGYLFVPDAWY